MPQKEIPNQLARLVSAELIKSAAAITGFKFTKPEFGSAANISGVRARSVMFSQRHDSRTMFASDSNYGYLGKAGAWTKDDKSAVAACSRLLRAAKVPAKEVAAIRVVSEIGQVAERVSDKEFRSHEPTLLRKLARAYRSIDGIPVWSSYATVGLNKAGGLGWLELHWPEISSTLVKEAGVLQSLVKRGFQAPEVKGARLEKVEAGLIHSPAIGFFLDVAAAIRVIYAVETPEIGRKPVLYLDRHGKEVTAPRDVTLGKPTGGDQPRPKPYATA